MFISVGLSCGSITLEHCLMIANPCGCTVLEIPLNKWGDIHARGISENEKE